MCVCVCVCVCVCLRVCVCVRVLLFKFFIRADIKIVVGLHFDICLYICKYLYKELTKETLILFRAFSFLTITDNQPNVIRLDCLSSELYKFHLLRSNHVDQPQESLGFLLTHSSKQMLGSWHF